MKKALVTYYSRTGNTAKMAQTIAAKLKEKGVDTDLQPVEEVDVDSLPSYDGFIVGSPNYFGTMAHPVKKLIDDSVKHFNKLDGKLVAAFASEGMIGGGGDSVLVDILKAFMVHGCVVQGLASVAHYGPVAIGAPGERVAKEEEVLVDRFVALLNKL